MRTPDVGRRVVRRPADNEETCLRDSVPHNRPRRGEQWPALDRARTASKKDETWLGLALHIVKALVDDVRDVDEASRAAR